MIQGVSIAIQGDSGAYLRFISRFTEAFSSRGSSDMFQSFLRYIRDVPKVQCYKIALYWHLLDLLVCLEHAEKGVELAKYT